MPGRPRYPVLVHRAAVLLHASFRPRLATTPLRFANPSPPSGWIEDFHLQAVDHARHTTDRPAAWPVYPNSHLLSVTLLRMFALRLCVQPVSATPLVVYRLAFGSRAGALAECA